ncbi:Na+/solute symporter [Dethiosulfovibrio peptidovorans DSM 11002]|uniref:Na+/solute symporter n=1 Tax=Dethiosulfovibrio peptidovorans DSM 11002 TaxID=469381 RepID=D2Z6X2_9BACT|nr:sodium:solute symporter family protein [Dethiosulfovibrio peptidovorans]EFC91219.1 Na+/solute symporter [Dethiosulfovibrio peptidovorans DSM 11002]
MSGVMLSSGIALWFLLGSLVSWQARRRSGSGLSDYFLANRAVGGFVSALTYSATTYSAFMMVGLVGLTYRTGVAALGFEFTYLIFTVLLLVLFAPRYWAAGRAFDLVSPTELLSFRYGSRKVGFAAACLCLVMLIPYASVQLMGVGYLLETLSGGAIPFVAGSGAAALIAVTFCLAGMRSVAWTDSLQALVMFVASLLLTAFVVIRFFPDGFVLAVSENPDLLKVNWSLPMYLGLTLPWAFFAVTNPQVVQRLYTPENPRSLRNMILGFSGFGLIYTLICGLLGFSVAIINPGLENADRAMPVLLSQVPVALGLVVTVSIMAAAVSTLNSVVLTLSSMFGRDVARPLSPGMSEEGELHVGRLMIPVVAVACFLFAQFRFDLIVVLSAMASGGLLMQLPAVLGAFFWRRGTAWGALSSLVIGGAVVAGLSLAGLKPMGQWPALWGLAISSVTFVVVSLFTSPPENCSRFFYGMKGEMEGHF